MEKPVINIVTHLYDPAIGGVEKYSENLAKHFIQRSYKVNVITTDSHTQPQRELKDGINIFRMSSLFLVERRFPVPYNLLQIIRIYKEFFKKRRTFTIIQTRLFLTSFIGLILARISGDEVIIIEHGSAHLSYQNAFAYQIFKAYEHIFTFILKLFRPRFYAVSKSGSEWLNHFGIKSMGEIPNGIDLNLTDNLIIPEELASLEGKTIITYLGRLLPAKGVVELIEAFMRLQNQSAHLIIAGAGVLADEIQKYADNNSNIHFLGKLEHKKALGLLSKSNIFVNPSNYPEGLPTIILEAGAFSLPVISTPNGGSKEVIEHLKTGFLINKGSQEEITKALEYLINHPKEAELMGRNLQRVINSTYNWDVILDKLINEFNL